MKQIIVAESTGALPIRSVATVQCYAEGLLSFYFNTLQDLLGDARRSDAVVDTRKLDRCVRAHLHFQYRHCWIPTGLIDHSTPDLRAELLAVDSLGDPKNVRDLIVATLRTLPYNQTLRLQPIVWGHLFSKIMPFDREVYELLFHALPAIYWSVNSKDLPRLYPNEGLSMPMISTGDRPETLATAISESLFTYIGDILLEGCDDFKVQDSISYHDPTSQLPEPDDPRVCFLLSMAGSPSIHRMNTLDSSLGTFFSAVL
ncbi:uncharacterized protein EV420DRAFT_1551913, partial [Desarmillaria tabescens]